MARQDGEHSGTASRAIDYAARAGYAAKGFVYGTIGVLATMTAMGFRGGRILGPRSAVEVLRSQRYGQALLWALVIGLCGYVAWRLVQAWLDPDGHGTDAGGLTRRAAFVVSALSYAALAWFTAGLAMGEPARQGARASGSAESTAVLLQHVWGTWVVASVGAVFVGVGCAQGYRAWRGDFPRRWRVGRMTEATIVWGTRVARVGLAARAVAFALVGWFFLQAALQADPSEARGLAGALRAFRERPYGNLWLGAIGAGFVCYALYCAIESRYRRIAV